MPPKTDRRKTGRRKKIDCGHCDGKGYVSIPDGPDDYVKEVCKFCEEDAE
jgi:hypothetical protein